MADTQAERVWFRLMRLHTRAHAAISDRLRAIGLSVPQCDVLTTLSEREGIAQQELAARLYVTKGNISGLIDRLAKAGLVERRQSREDKRSHSLYLTEEGRRLALQGIAIQRQFVTDAFGHLDPTLLGELETSLIAVRDGIRIVSNGK
ncbi:MAG: MarR family winged helix-turn-helix transcriptional regulator [Beijerinckiaceae bacterium]